MLSAVGFALPARVLSPMYTDPSPGQTERYFAYRLLCTHHGVFVLCAYWINYVDRLIYYWNLWYMNIFITCILFAPWHLSLFLQEYMSMQIYSVSAHFTYTHCLFKRLPHTRFFPLTHPRTLHPSVSFFLSLSPPLPWISFLDTGGSMMLEEE